MFPPMLYSLNPEPSCLSGCEMWEGATFSKPSSESERCGMSIF